MKARQAQERRQLGRAGEGVFDRSRQQGQGGELGYFGRGQMVPQFQERRLRRQGRTDRRTDQVALRHHIIQVERQKRPSRRRWRDTTIRSRPVTQQPRAAAVPDLLQQLRRRRQDRRLRDANKDLFPPVTPPAASAAPAPASAAPAPATAAPSPAATVKASEGSQKVTRRGESERPRPRETSRAS